MCPSANSQNHKIALTILATLVPFFKLSETNKGWIYSCSYTAMLSAHMFTVSLLLGRCTYDLCCGGITEYICETACHQQESWDGTLPFSLHLIWTGELSERVILAIETKTLYFSTNFSNTKRWQYNVHESLLRTDRSLQLEISPPEWGCHTVLPH